MAFIVADFHDLIRLLGEHPEWRAELRRYVLPDELVELPALVRRLAEAQAELTQRVEELAEAQARTEQRVDALAQAVTALITEMSEFRREVEGFKVDLAQLKVEVHGLTNDVGLRQGVALERHYREFGSAYFSTVVRRPRVLARAALADLLDADVSRAQFRALTLQKLGQPVLPVVAGHSVLPDADAVARASGIWRVLNDRGQAPN